ncbi:hypothetical protein [Pradoshia sp.]
MNTAKLIDQVTIRIYERDPSLTDRYGEKGIQKCKADNQHHLDHLYTAAEMNDAAIFTDYTHWLNGILQKFKMGTQTLLDNYEILKEELDHVPVSEISRGRREIYQSLLSEGIQLLEAEKAIEEV